MILRQATHGAELSAICVNFGAGRRQKILRRTQNISFPFSVKKAMQQEQKIF